MHILGLLFDVRANAIICFLEQNKLSFIRTLTLPNMIGLPLYLHSLSLPFTNFWYFNFYFFLKSFGASSIHTYKLYIFCSLILHWLISLTYPEILTNIDISLVIFKIALSSLNFCWHSQVPPSYQFIPMQTLCLWERERGRGLCIL